MGLVLSLSTMEGNGRFHEPGNRPSPGNETICWHLDLGLPASRTLRHTFLLANHQANGILLEQHKQTGTGVEVAVCICEPSTKQEQPGRCAGHPKQLTSTATSSAFEISLDSSVHSFCFGFASKSTELYKLKVSEPEDVQNEVNQHIGGLTAVKVRQRSASCQPHSDQLGDLLSTQLISSLGSRGFVMELQFTTSLSFECHISMALIYT